MSESINLNQAECIKTVTGFGKQVYHNICEGTHHVVPWGAGDWLGAALFAGAAIAIFTAIAMFLYMAGQAAKGGF